VKTSFAGSRSCNRCHATRARVNSTSSKRLVWSQSMFLGLVSQSHISPKGHDDTTTSMLIDARIEMIDMQPD
jgi:hypothetical protein